MITKLIVLNGTEGHKFEVGKNYANTDNPKKVDEISSNGTGGYVVYFEDRSSAHIVTENIMVFYS